MCFFSLTVFLRCDPYDCFEIAVKGTQGAISAFKGTLDHGVGRICKQAAGIIDAIAVDVFIEGKLRDFFEISGKIRIVISRFFGEVCE